MKKIVVLFVVCCVFISCKGNEDKFYGDVSKVLGLSWGTDYTKAKEILVKNGYKIKDEKDNTDNNEAFQKNGLISSFSVIDFIPATFSEEGYEDNWNYNGKCHIDNSNVDETENSDTTITDNGFTFNFSPYDWELGIQYIYKLIFHSNKLASAKITIRSQIFNLNEIKSDVPEKLLNEIKNKLIKKYGSSYIELRKYESLDFYELIWEKNNFSINCSVQDSNSKENYVFQTITLYYKNEKFYNDKLLKRYKTIEDTWISERVETERNEFNQIGENLLFMSTDYFIYKFYFNDNQMILEKYDHNLFDFSSNNNDKLLSTEGPYPYKINKNKIVVTDEKGNIKEYEYNLNKETLTVTIDNQEVILHRFP